MRIIPYFLFIALFCLNAFACTDAMKAYEYECKIQDRYLSLSNQFNTLAINMTDLKGFKIPRALGKLSYFSAKNDLLNHSEVTLSQNHDWQNWNNGQKFINNLNPIFLGLNDILKLHKNLFSGKNFLDVGSDIGKIRTNNGETNPKVNLNCKDKILNQNLFNMIADYDLKSVEGYPLLSLDNIVACNDSVTLSADLYFYKGASIKIELNRWLVDLNDMLSRYEKGEMSFDVSPVNYLSDMRRWFLAIRPFSAGNEQVIDALIDYSSKRIRLPSLPLNDSIFPIYLSVSENRASTIKKLDETLKFFEGCLFEHKMKLISPECSVLK